jgi:hypothetical protein
MAFRAGYAEHAPLPPTSPVIEAAAWLRLAHRGLSRGVDPDLWGFALKRAAQAREVAA